MRYDSITELIGNTPLVRVDPATHGLRNIDLFAKMEMLNPFGSVKDRAAWNMVHPLLEDAVAADQTIIELSSGNTGKALATIAGMHGLSFKTVTNRMKVPEIKEFLMLLGSEIEELPGQTECPDPTDPDNPLARIHRLLAEHQDGYIHTDQYYNARNAEAHRRDTGPEIIADLGGVPDYFVAGVGTAGSSAGIAAAMRDHGPGTTVVGVVAGKSDYIPGIRNFDEVNEVGLFDLANYDVIESITSGEAIDGMLELSRRCGMLGGPTAGAAYHAAIRYLAKVDTDLEGSGERKTAVFIVCDRAESYMSYVRQRRPELFRQRVSQNSLASVTEADLDTVRTLTVPQAQQWIATEHPLVIDLRGPFAYRAQHIPGSVNIVDELFEELVRGGMPFGSEQPVLLACPVGERSARYAALLTRMGHSRCHSLAGGIVAWRDAEAEMVHG